MGSKHRGRSFIFKLENQRHLWVPTHSEATFCFYSYVPISAPVRLLLKQPFGYSEATHWPHNGADLHRYRHPWQTVPWEFVFIPHICLYHLEVYRLTFTYLHIHPDRHSMAVACATPSAAPWRNLLAAWVAWGSLWAASFCGLELRCQRSPRMGCRIAEGNVGGS